jgi:hypothetical protein
MKKIMWTIGLIVVLLAGPILPAEAAGGGGFHGGGARMGGAGFHGGGARWGGGGWHGGARGWNGGWHGGTRVFIGGGFGWWGWPGWWGPGWWGTYPYYADPSVVVQQAPTQYIQQDPAPPSAPQYWYYCQNAGAYYPYVKDCPGDWITVVPQPASPDR